MSYQTETAAGLVTYTADPAHSRVGFTVRHMGFSKVRGSFGDFDAVIRMEPGNLESLEAEATIRTQSVSTRASDRDAHLRSPDFFKIEEHPEMTFRSKEVRDIRGDRFKLVGELSLRGVTREVVLDATFLGEGKDPWGGRRVGFEAQTTISRKDYGLLWNQVLESGGLLVSDEVQIEIELQATEQQES
jgi:polyisoprenoid-binding protein YceI